ncbi:MAG: class I SAM-dependent methyltransferase [Myxococcota bacterium]
MQARALDWLICPSCGAGLAAEGASAVVRCAAGHRFPIRAGVPRLLTFEALGSAPAAGSAKEDDALAIGDSFGAEWEQFDYDKSRTWHETVEDRCKLWLQELDTTPAELAGRVVLDAGCGNGTLSVGVSDFGCDVLAVDVSDSVTRAHAFAARKNNQRVHFVQGDLTNLPVKPESMDFVYSSGVLHHNPNTLEALRVVARALKPGGKIYIWLYHPEPGLKFWLQLRLRSLIAPLPGPVKRAFVHAWVVQAMARQHLRTLFGVNDEYDRLTWQERTVDLMDIYTPRYRWMHTQDEVHGWYRELGFEAIKTSEVRKWGFGVVATKPAKRAG